MEGDTFMATTPHTKPEKTRFHGRGVVAEQYPLAKDRREIWRLNLQHRLMKKALGNRNFRAPVRNPHAILDVACGTGIWSLEVARHFRQAQQVLGIDKHMELTQALLRINDRLGRIPKSLAFQEMDALQPFPFDDGAFDFTHGRFMSPFIPVAQWPQVVAEMVRVTTSGGWVEIAEAELSDNEGPLLAEVNQALTALGEKLGIVPAGASVGNFLRGAGLQRVQSQRVLLGGKDLAKNVGEAMHSFAPALLHTKIIAKDRMDAILAGFEAEVQQYGIQLPVDVGWGQKPWGDGWSWSQSALEGFSA